MKYASKRLLAVLLCTVMVLSICLVAPMPAEAANHGVYKDLAMVTNLSGSGCPSMQGMALCGDYFYVVKTDGNDGNATVCRVHRTDGTKTWMTNTADSSYLFYDFGHGNDIEVVKAGGTINMFIPTSTKGSDSLVRYTISGTNATKYCGYTMMYNGSQLGGGSIRAVRVDDENIYLLFKSGAKCYTGTLPISQNGGTLEMKYLCTLDYSTAVVNGVETDTSGWSLQGMGYYDHMLYLPLSSHTTSDTSMSIVLVYDLQGASGTIKPLDDPTFKITSSTYAALFEMESCIINPHNGLLYFTTNRRKSSSDTNYDGLSYITNWVYEPDQRTSEVKDYRWEMRDGKLIAATTEGSSYNGLAHHGGSVTDSNISKGKYATSQNINLMHDRPWVLEWRSKAFSAGSLMFSTHSESKYTDNAYIFCRVNNVLISVGYHDGTQYNNYGINPQDYGIDTSLTHTYRLTNKIASDGSNMVYLSVDGMELGALNNYYIASTAQGTTSNWVSGKDLSFSYLGTAGHPLNLNGVEYIQIWGDGIPAEDKTANTYRWETSNNALTAVTGGNSLTMNGGSVSGTTYTGVQYDLSKDVVLLHDRNWSIEWKGSYSSGTMLLSADHLSYTESAPYLYRSGILAFGERKNGSFHNYGIKLSDHGIGYADNHVYKLSNRVAADGSNMVYLFVDGVEIGAMNNYYTGTTAAGTTSDWLNGRDMTFSYIGTYQFMLAGELEYMQINEGCVHSFGAWSASTATCTQSGTRTRTCTLCGEEETETVAASGHSYTGSVTAPTCTADGYTTYTCTCGDSYISDTVAATGHSYTGAVTKEPSCDAEGVTTYTCACGDSYTESIAATSHSYNAGIVTKEATCDEDGVKTYTCFACGSSYTETIPATGHSYNSGIVTKAATCEVDGVKTYTCFACADSYTEVIAATGHSYSIQTIAPTCTDAGYTTYTCVCGDSYVGGGTPATGHSYVDGNCAVCGAADPDAVVAPTISLAYPTLLLEDVIKMNVYFTLDQDIELSKLGMLTWTSAPSTVDINTADAVIPGATYYSDLGYYGVTTEAIPAQNLGDTVYFCIYAELADGSYAYGKQVSYSPTTYAYNQLKATSTTDAAKSLYVAILNYGAAAQTYLGYNTDALINASLTDEMKAYVNEYSSDMVHSVSAVSATKQGTLASNGGFSAKKPSISLDGAFAINYYFTPNATVDGEMTFYYWNAADFASVDVLSIDNATGSAAMTADSGVYGAAIEGIAAKDIDGALYACGVYTDANGNTYSTGILPYSLGVYCGNQAVNGTEKVQPLAAAIAVYGYYAANFFAGN